MKDIHTRATAARAQALDRFAAVAQASPGAALASAGVGVQIIAARPRSDLSAYRERSDSVAPGATGEGMYDLLDEAEARFHALQSYRATLHSAGRTGDRQVMHYSYRKPGWVRIDCVEPHRGAVLIYDPGTRKVRLWTFGLGFGRGFPFGRALSLAPDNPLVRSPRGHTIDRSDVGALFENLQVLRADGSFTPIGAGTVAGEPTLGFEAAAAAGITIGGVHRNRVWLAQDTLFPRRVESFDAANEIVEIAELTDADLDVCFPDRFFTP